MVARTRVAALSIGPSKGAPGDAFGEAQSAIEAMADRDIDLFVLPELFALPYVAGEDPDHWRHLEEPLDGPTGEWALTMAAQYKTNILYGTSISRRPGRPFNAAVLARESRKLELVSTKIHFPPKGEGDFYGEEDHFAPGVPQVATFAVGMISVAAVVCYDRRFPEIWRRAAAAGADLVAVLVAGPAYSEPEGFYLGELRTHAQNNGVYAVAAARYGCEEILSPPVRHDGVTAMVTPDGSVVAEDDSRYVVVDVDRNVRANAERMNPTSRRLRVRG